MACDIKANREQGFTHALLHHTPEGSIWYWNDDIGLKTKSFFESNTGLNLNDYKPIVLTPKMVELWLEIRDMNNV